MTAGNASGINDSAAAVLLMSEDEIQKRSIKPLAKIIAFAQSGIEPEIMGMGPVSAVQEVVSLSGIGEENLKKIAEISLCYICVLLT